MFVKKNPDRKKKKQNKKKNDQYLVFDPLTKRKVQKFTDLNIEKHMLHSRKLLSNLTQKTLQPAFVSDEKIFKVKKVYN